MVMEQRQTVSLGNTISMLCQDAEVLTTDRRVAATLAASRLERVLVRAGNARLAMALAHLAGELAPTASRRRPYAAASLFVQAA